MFTILESKSANPRWSDKLVVEAVCLSTDTKPTTYANGSMCLEMDTGKIYAFNETASTWVEIGA